MWRITLWKFVYFCYEQQRDKLPKISKTHYEFDRMNETQMILFLENSKDKKEIPLKSYEN